MQHQFRFKSALVMAAMVIASLACNAPGGGAANATPTLPLGTIFIPTVLAEAPTNTPVASPTEAATTGPSNTPVPACTVTAKEQMNVRSGPSTSHALIRQLGAGEAAAVTGRNENSTWWQINGNEWVFGDLVQANGECEAIGAVTYPTAVPSSGGSGGGSGGGGGNRATNTPVPPTAAPAQPTATPVPPTATPDKKLDFTLDYIKSYECRPGLEKIVFGITNTGQDPILSISWVLKNKDGDRVGRGESDSPFWQIETLSSSQCDKESPESGRIYTGGTAMLHLTVELPPAGQAGSIELQICNGNGLGGDCYDKTINFTYNY
jgi:uncharacterized protein YraI